MRIVVDGLPLWVRSAGVATYTKELVKALVRLNGSHEYCFSDLGMRIGKTVLPAGCKSTECDEKMNVLGTQVPFYWKATLLLPFGIRQLLLQSRIAHSGANLYFGTNFFGMFHRSFKTVITIHDMHHIHYPECTIPHVYKTLIKRLPHHAQQAHAIFADSEATKRDIIAFLKIPVEKVHVITCGVGDAFQPIHDEQHLNQVRASYNLPRCFLLYVGTLEPRKNLSRLLEAFELLASDSSFEHGLVLTGATGWQYLPFQRRLAKSPVRHRIILTGKVPTEHLLGIYNLADILVFPSLFEGFGLPILEAMACGTTVVTSNISSLPEVAGDAAILVNPHSPNEIANAVRSILDNESLAQSLREKGFARVKQFSWDKTAQKVLTIFHTLTQS